MEDHGSSAALPDARDAKTRRKSGVVSLRIAPDLKNAVEDASNRHPYRPSMTAIVERGLVLAMAEMEAQTASLSKATGQ